MNKNILPALAVVAILALAVVPAKAWFVDTNATTTTTVYTPSKPSDLLIGKKGSTNAAWIAVGQTTNDWMQISE